MIYKGTKVEITDPATRFVLKRTSTSDWETLNRKLAVNNQLRAYEEQRNQYNKPAFPSCFQTHHIRWDKRGFWDFYDIDVAKANAQKNNRIFVAQRQLNSGIWDKLTRQEAFNWYEELVNRGLPIPTMQIPLKEERQIVLQYLPPSVQSIIRPAKRLA